MWYVWPDSNQVTSHIAGNMLAYMPYTRRRFNIHQFTFGVIMPEKMVSQARFKKPE